MPELLNGWRRLPERLGCDDVSSRPVDLVLPVLQMPKACDVLARLLREKILNHELRVGDALPSERDLWQRTRMSRASVREALRLLEADGLIRSRPGRNGGAFVCRPDPNVMVRPVELLVRGRRIPFRSVIETREAIEPASAALAATCRTSEDIDRLEAISRSLESSIGDVGKYLSANLDWHLAVIEASHNELMIGFMRAVSGTVYAATDIENFTSIEVQEAVAKAHRKVGQAIIAGDADAARRRMARHLNAYSKQVAAYAPSYIDIS